MEKKTLSNILEGKIFNIPDYQRGYAWENRQWDDFIEDIDTLIDDKIISHYTGTIVLYQPNSKPTNTYGNKRLEIVDVVDGQQRLTTCALYLSIILNKLIETNHDEYKVELYNYLFTGTKTKLILNNDTADCYYDLITKGQVNTEVYTIHQKRIVEAYDYLKNHIDTKYKSLGPQGENYLIDIFDAIIRKLNFSFYTIEQESEIGMTFELMNSRGKDLSSLEKLKNYFMYWIYRNIYTTEEKDNFTAMINKTWRDVFINIVQCNGNEDQCLRILWIFYVSHAPKNWDGYSGFKSDEVIPIRHFDKKTLSETHKLLEQMIKGLSVISFHYSQILKPTEENCFDDEYKWLKKIRRADNISTFLPLLIAARIEYYNKRISQDEYISLLIKIEIFSYRVFIIEKRRSNTALTRFYRWSSELYHRKIKIPEINNGIIEITNWYSDENFFRTWLTDETDNWYEQYKRALRYTLFEYELFLLETEGKDVKPKLDWAGITDSTIEHILPQTPEKNSKWKKEWSNEDRKNYLHDISNLVLTNDNSHYKNFEFEVKKGHPGIGHCYSNSDIRQERKISNFKEWNVKSCKARKKELANWIIERWGIDENI